MTIENIPLNIKKIVWRMPRNICC